MEGRQDAHAQQRGPRDTPIRPHAVSLLQTHKKNRESQEQLVFTDDQDARCRHPAASVTWRAQRLRGSAHVASVLGHRPQAAHCAHGLRRGAAQKVSGRRDGCEYGRDRGRHRHRPRATATSSSSSFKAHAAARPSTNPREVGGLLVLGECTLAMVLHPRPCSIFHLYYYPKPCFKL